jgi:hypothetical protein
MPQSNRITVEVYPLTEEPELPITFEDVHYVSYISSPGGQGEGTYGIPAILSDARAKGEGLPLRVLYVNPANIVAMKATRTA